MPGLDATLTWALPVNVVQLGAHLQAYIVTLPALNALHACNRFGRDSHISKLPVELVQRIAHYYILPVRGEALEHWSKAIRCYEDDCDVFDHYSRDELRDTYKERNHGCGDPECPGCLSNEPSDEELSDIADGGYAYDNQEAHSENQRFWEVASVAWLDKERPKFHLRFGLDIWLSRVNLGWSNDYEIPKTTTVTYLTLPQSITRSEHWNNPMSDHGYRDIGDSGFGMPVNLDQLSTPKSLQRFKRALRILDLTVSVHTSQQGKTLSIMPDQKIDELDGAKTNAASRESIIPSYPRPMFLVRSQIEAE